MNTPVEQLAEHTVTAPVVKVATAWGAVGIAAWVDIAQLIATTLAAIYTLALLCEWIWKKSKWLRRKDRRHDDKK